MSYFTTHSFDIAHVQWLLTRSIKLSLSFNTITTIALDLKSCSAILLSASWLPENHSCNEETPSSVLHVCSPPLLTIGIFFPYFLWKTIKWIGYILFSPPLNSLNYLLLSDFHLWKPLINHSGTKFISTLTSCTFFITRSQN